MSDRERWLLPAVRFQHLRPFVSAARANAGNKGETVKLLILVEFPNPTFDFEAGVRRVSDVKSIPPADSAGTKRSRDS
jgi:hypothetical protein